MEFIWIIVAIFIVAIILGVASASGKITKLQEFKKSLTEKHPMDDVYVSSFDMTYLGFNFDLGTIYVGSEFAQYEYGFGRIATVEIAKNNSAMVQTNRGSQLLGAAVGGVMFGGAGALVGGLTGSSRSNDRLKSLSIKIIVDDPGAPNHSILFFESPEPKGSDPSGIIVTQSSKDIERFHALLLNAMRKATEQSTSAAPSSPENATDKLANLERLAALRDAGSISETEFKSLKTELLAKLDLTDEVATTASNDASTYTVYLDDAGSKKIMLLQRLVEIIPELTLEKAVARIKSLPTPLQSGVSESQASRIQDSLAALGARTRREVDEN
ncbi:ribosomal protein L7/L12 [Maricaulis sp.]|uniref:ribosomal protein L7/L12 n=1 Tax=Maricaulis sp. TaxID=1486257 RepID=UPI003A953E1A